MISPHPAFHVILPLPEAHPADVLTSPSCSSIPTDKDSFAPRKGPARACPYAACMRRSTSFTPPITRTRPADHSPPDSHAHKHWPGGLSTFLRCRSDGIPPYPERTLPLTTQLPAKPAIRLRAFPPLALSRSLARFRIPPQSPFLTRHDLGHPENTYSVLIFFPSAPRFPTTFVEDRAGPPKRGFPIHPFSLLLLLRMDFPFPHGYAPGFLRALSRAVLLPLWEGSA